MKFLVHPVNKGLVNIHYKYFIRNSILHHFLFCPVMWNIHVSINLTSYTSSKLAGYAKHYATLEHILKNFRIFFCISGITMCMPLYLKTFTGLNVPCLWYYTIHQYGFSFLWSNAHPKDISAEKGPSVTAQRIFEFIHFPRNPHSVSNECNLLCTL